MTSIPKVRFSVQTLGSTHELFSVTERKNGDLIIVGNDTSHVADMTDSINYKISDRHFSVHISDKGDSRGTTLKQTVVSVEGSVLEYAAFINGDREDLIFPLFARCQWRFDGDNMLMSRIRDDVINICDYDERLTTLLFMVYIGGPSPNPDPMRKRSVWHNFKNFSVGVYYSFLPVAPPNFGSALAFTTSTIRKNKGEYIQTHQNAGPIGPEEFVDYTAEIFEILRQHVGRLAIRTDRSINFDHLLRIYGSMGIRYSLKDRRFTDPAFGR